MNKEVLVVEISMSLQRYFHFDLYLKGLSIVESKYTDNNDKSQ